MRYFTLGKFGEDSAGAFARHESARHRQSFPMLARGARFIGVFLTVILGAAGGFADTVSFSYDPAGRLTGMFFQDGRSIHYTYDKNGNILRSLVSIIVDTDGDGMDDNWETAHFENTARNGREDFDADGQTDLHEFLAGTDPKDSASVFALGTRPEISPSAVTLMWTAAPGKRYVVEFKNSLSAPEWTPLDGVVEASGQVAFKADPTATASQHRFYRVSLAE